MRRPYRPNAKEATAWETDPEPESEDDEEPEAESDTQEEETTEAPGTEENQETEEDSNPPVLKPSSIKLRRSQRTWTTTLALS